MAIIQDKSLQEKIGFEPHEGQQDILDAILEGRRDIVIAAGRRWGKSKICAYIALRYLLASNKRIWLVAPTYDLTQKVFNHLTPWIHQHFPVISDGVTTRPTPKIINRNMNSWIECKSADSPEGLLGEELDLVIIDEAARIKKQIWEQYIYPCLGTRHGKAIMISTPLGQNWFYHRYLDVKQAEDGASFQFPSKTSPYLSEEEWQRAKEKLPERLFKQEYVASFEPESAGVFKNVRDCISGRMEGEDAEKDEKYVMGVDLGKLNDFTVIIVIHKRTRQVVYFERFQDINWKLQRTRIKAVSERYNRARIYIDSTGKGDPLVDELSAEGLMLEPYTIGGNKAKRQLVEKLAAFLHNKKIAYPPIEVLIDELEAFTYNATEKGVIRYGAPTGLHDDCVMALALAVWGLTGREKNLTPIQEEVLRMQRSQKRQKSMYK